MSTVKSPPEIEAEGLLRTLWPRAGSGPVAPIDPVSIARDLGLQVFEVKLPDGELSGMLVKERGGQPRIYLNQEQHPHRRRFTCAHEIGHFIKRGLDNDSEAFEYVDRRSHLSSQGTDPDERWANAFAAALLMPADYIRDRFQWLGHTGLAQELRVSLEAISNRIGSLQSAGRL